MRGYEREIAFSLTDDHPHAAAVNLPAWVC